MTAYDYFVEKADVFLQHCDEDKKTYVLAGIRSYFKDLNIPEDKNASSDAIRGWVQDFLQHCDEDKKSTLDKIRLYFMDMNAAADKDASSIAAREWTRFCALEEDTFFAFFLNYSTIAYLQQIKDYSEALAISRYRCGFQLPKEKYREISYLFLSAENTLSHEQGGKALLEKLFGYIPGDLMYAAGLSRYIRPPIIKKAMSANSTDLFIYCATPFILLSNPEEKEKVLEGIRFYFDNVPYDQHMNDSTFVKQEWNLFSTYKVDRFLSFFKTLSEIKEILAYCASLALSRYRDGSLITLHENRDIADELIIRINRLIVDERHLPLFNSILSRGAGDLLYACGINSEIRPELLCDLSAHS